MTKEFAWLLGYLLSDGHLAKNKDGSLNGTLSFICKYDDREILYKVKEILKSHNKVGEYPHYKSPSAQLKISDCKKIAETYPDIKTVIPAEDIKGYERHFIRGLVDGDGTLCMKYRNGTRHCRFAFIDEYPQIVQWVVDTMYKKLDIPLKAIRYVPQSHVWEVQREGTLARVIAWWLYHGDIENCCLERKRQKYLQEVADGKYFKTEDEALLYAAKAYIQDNSIHMNKPSMNTLTWCHILQKGLSFNTAPVFHNPGKRKYYLLHISANKTIIDTQDAQEIA